MKYSWIWILLVVFFLISPPVFAQNLPQGNLPAVAVTIVETATFSAYARPDIEPPSAGVYLVYGLIITGQVELPDHDIDFQLGRSWTKDEKYPNWPLWCIEWYDEVWEGRRQDFLPKEILQEMGYPVSDDRDNIIVVSIISLFPITKGGHIFDVTLCSLPGEEIGEVSIAPLITPKFFSLFLSPSSQLAPKRPVYPTEMNNIIRSRQKEQNKLATTWGAIKT